MGVRRDVEFISLIEQGAHSHDYASLWRFQLARLEEIYKGEAPECIIFCEHEPVITKGRRFTEGNILQTNVPIHSIERGGDVTWHGPGQLVVYPLLKLHGDIFKKGLHEYLRFCEEVLINVLRQFSLDAGRFGPTGVWVRKEAEELRKIASLGVAVRRWITFHGMALNVNNDLSAFEAIRPCNFDSSIMTSMAREGVATNTTEMAVLIRNEILRQLDLTEANILGETTEVLRSSVNF